MAGPKAKTPAPIDRPLSRAYLREFGGWSTAYPPGLSDPTSLRIMENILITRDGAAAIRPGMRYLSYIQKPPLEGLIGYPINRQIVGTHEVFFLNDGSKAYLFAVREPDETIGFRVLLPTTTGDEMIAELTDPGVEFEIDGGIESLNFSAATTYVKYLQIDNRIFALSNAGEPMRLFYVGTEKRAKRMNSISRPAWNLDDKLTVVHPVASWITGGAPASTRENLLLNPSFETSVGNWTPSTFCQVDRVALTSQVGDHAARLLSKPARTNLMPQPLTRVANLANPSRVDGWYASTGSRRVEPAEFGYLGWVPDGPTDQRDELSFMAGPAVSVVAGRTYDVGMEWGNLPMDDATNGYGLRIIWRNSAGGEISRVDNIRAVPTGTIGHRLWAGNKAPAGATRMQIYPLVRFRKLPKNSASFIPTSPVGRIRNVVICAAGESTAGFDGDSGSSYFWTGAAENSPSVYHPPVDISLTANYVSVVAGSQYAFLVHRQHGGAARNVRVHLDWVNASGTRFGRQSIDSSNDGPAMTPVSAVLTAPAGAVGCYLFVFIPALPRSEAHYVDAAMVERSATVEDYFDGDTPSTTTLKHTWTGTRHASKSRAVTYTQGLEIPTPNARTADTLISSTTKDNSFNYGFFYTFSNEIGESAASQITTLRTQRGQGFWSWSPPKSDGSPDDTLPEVTDPNMAADQLVAFMPEDVFNEAKAAGATRWNLYMLTWSNQDSVPTNGMLIGSKELKADSVYGSDGWQRATPQMNAIGELAALPSETTRYNFSDPSKASNGLVAADRMILVADPSAAAVIRWSSNQQGDYSNFSASKGGGYKTLTTGNLYVPAAVKLWQNPQSVDTLTILCQGVDGHSTGYYMAPAQVTSQSETTQVMGFEETTATPGTVAPYGNEVMNNALYHPLDTELMKSTATSYNINHKSMTEQIRDVWVRLTRKAEIVSAQLDNRIYYIVSNPDGEPIEAGCRGNELWVFDGGSEGGTWSRFLIQAHSLRKIEVGGRAVLSVVRPDGIFFLDDTYGMDDYVSGGAVLNRPIPWRLETNTQGANRAHDAWAHLQQLSVSLGNFQGSLRWGIRGWAREGFEVDIEKTTRDLNPAGELAFDIEDQLRVARGMKEWFFYASNIEDDNGNPLPSYGQINSAQYRYTPLSVNTGYEDGSVETFEYGRDTAYWGDGPTVNGVVTTANDPGRP